MYRMRDIEEPHEDAERVLHYFMCSLRQLDPFGTGHPLGAFYGGVYWEGWGLDGESKEWGGHFPLKNQLEIVPDRFLKDEDDLVLWPDAWSTHRMNAPGFRPPEYPRAHDWAKWLIRDMFGEVTEWNRLHAIGVMSRCADPR